MNSSDHSKFLNARNKRRHHDRELDNKDRFSPAFSAAVLEKQKTSVTTQAITLMKLNSKYYGTMV